MIKWSYSTAQTLRRCQRQLYYTQVLASHNAHDPLRRRTYVLKQLQHLRAWQGSLVHGVLATDFLGGLRARQRPNPTRLAAAAIAKAGRQFTFSAARRYLTPGQSKAAAGDDYAALFEHEFGPEPTADDLLRVQANIALAFNNLAGMRELLAELYSGWNQRSEWPLRFSHHDAAINANIDLISLRRQGQPTIVDWKVSESVTADHARQLHVYGWALIRSGGWPEQRAAEINLYEVNLLKNLVHRHPFDGEMLAVTESFVNETAAALSATVPAKPPADLQARLPIAEQPATCRGCPFQRICPAQLTDAGRIADAEEVLARI